MGTEWTTEQKRVIALRNSSILVSAAAGSGKTAVLVERIMSKLTDRTAPVSIDRMLIMTFTRAAAGELKERIRNALEQALHENPGSAFLQKQLMLIHMAQITTIDGFCGWLLRNYFHLIGLDPGYRIADEGELELLKQDTLKEMMEEFHKEDSPDFNHMLDCFCLGKTDESLKGVILRIYDKAMSSPDPQQWLADCAAGFDAQDCASMMEKPWMQDLFTIAETELCGMQEDMEQALRLCLSVNGPYHFEEGIREGLAMLSGLSDLCAKKDYDGIVNLLSSEKFPELSRKRPKDVDDSLKKNVSEIRNHVKASVDDLRKNWFSCDLEENLELLRLSRRPAETLIRTVERFMELFSAKKRDKNVLDFTDMEHLALKILSPGEGEKGGSAAAGELSEKFDEVMIDEYQDSNLVQERIAGYVSGWVNHRHNIFMVGDVKQSIYRFRLARPELFMEKYHRFSKEDGDEVRVDLHKNFRSRSEVLSAVNYIFRQIMGSDLGGIDYGEEEALYPGASFPEGQDEKSARAELLLVRKDDPLLEDEESVRTDRELEAMLIADRIQSMVGNETVYDRESGGHRPVRYGDIAILLRSFSGWSEPFMDVLTSRGIPAYAASRSGYFSASEVVTMLNYLRILDNPRQDIPLLGVLRSPIVSCTDEELAVLRSEYGGGMLFDSVTAFLADEEERKGDPLYEKLYSFAEMMNAFRRRAAFVPVHQLIREILRDTGYGSILKAMPDGAQRSANLEMLSEKAMEYAKTSYHGLFHFVQYIENLHKYEVDYGEVNLSGAGDGAVRLMTIHKSKGLEFPVVFVSGLGKNFNYRDANEAILVDADLGIAPDAVIPERGIRVPLLKKRLTREHIVSESIGEELRVLYVALTRAKEKLILTGSVGNFGGTLEKLLQNAARTRELLSLRDRRKAKCALDLILMALSGHRCMAPVFHEEGLLPGKNPLLHDDPSEFAVQIADVKKLVKDEAYSRVRDLSVLAYLQNADADQVKDAGIRKELEERFAFRYPHGELAGIPVKMTVSELKKRSYHEEEELENSTDHEEPVIPLVPVFLQEEQEEILAGSSRGTAYHRVMECLDYSAGTGNEEEIKKQLERLLEEKKLGRAEAASVRPSDIVRFAGSQLGRRMAEADRAGSLFREQPFMMARAASEIDPAWNSGTSVLIQGIIDAYFYEGNEIVLVDYKTDRVSGHGGAEKLLTLYRTQLDDYADALSRLTGHPVKEKYIWSFDLGREVIVD